MVAAVCTLAGAVRSCARRRRRVRSDEVRGARRAAGGGNATNRDRDVGADDLGCARRRATDPTKPDTEGR